MLVTAGSRSAASESSDSSSDGDEHIDVSADVLAYPWRQRFIDMVFRPAILRLSLNSLSRRKGAGIDGVAEWYLHPSDFPRVASYVDEIMASNDLNGTHL